VEWPQAAPNNKLLTNSPTLPFKEMSAVTSKIAFILASSAHGMLILSRLDYNTVGSVSYGVGIQTLENGSFDKAEVDLTFKLLELRKKYKGDGVVAIDCGANIGIHTIDWSRRMTEWGTVIAIEAQERIFYALAGNIAINNCFNARAIYAAVSATCGVLKIPTLDYQKPASFGSLELAKLSKTESIGQTVDYSDATSTDVRMISLDSLELKRCDFIKIDVEGMEISVLDGAAGTIDRYRPIILAETIKSNKENLRSKLQALGYEAFEVGINLLAIHNSDQTLTHVDFRPAT
jgi:FkbM family methyltransferase